MGIFAAGHVQFCLSSGEERKATLAAEGRKAIVERKWELGGNEGDTHEFISQPGSRGKFKIWFPSPQRSGMGFFSFERLLMSATRWARRSIQATADSGIVLK
jgi:hypothetical protein